MSKDLRANHKYRVKKPPILAGKEPCQVGGWLVLGGSICSEAVGI